MPKKIALLIGINDYPNLKKDVQLTGCHNDVRLIQNVLIDKFGFKSGDVCVLKSKEATKAAIAGAMDRLLADCGEGDVVLFFFSGHGFRLERDNETNPSGWCETLMPYDSKRNSGTEKDASLDITDEEIYGWLIRLAEKTPNIVLIFDSCHSSSITRDDEPNQERKGYGTYRALNERVDSAFPLAGLDDPVPKEKGPSGWLPLSSKHVLLAASREYEVAGIVRGSDGKVYGLFTYLLCGAFRNSAEEATYRDIWEEVLIGVRSHNKEQTPQIEGNLDREVLGHREFVPNPFLMIKQRQGSSVELAGGMIHGVVKGSEWLVFPACEKNAVRTRADEIGRIRILSVNPQTSTAELVSEVGKGPVKAGARVVEASRPGSKYRVSLRQPEERFHREAKSLKTELNKSVLIEEAASVDSADTIVEVAYFDEEEGQILEGQRKGEAQSYWTGAGRDNRLQFSPIPIEGDFFSVPSLITNLERLAAFQNLSSLKNTKSLLNGFVDFEIFIKGSSGEWTAATVDREGSIPKVIDSEQIALRIVNRFIDPIFVSILDLGLSKNVRLLYPSSGASELIDPGKKKPSGSDPFRKMPGVLSVGNEKSMRFNLFFPEKYVDFDSCRDQPSVPRQGLEIYKLIVTTRPHDLGFLTQEGVRSGPLPRGFGVERLLVNAFRGAADHFGEKTLSKHKDEWTTVELPFILADDL